MITWEPRHGQGLTFLVYYDMNWGGPGLRIARREDDGLYRAEINWVKVDVHEPCGEATLQCQDSEGPNDMQNLFNALWKAGYRPQSAMKQDAVIEAKDSHLSDLRKLLFSQMGVSE